MHSVINNESLKDFGALLILEPHVWRNNKGKIISTPLSHSNWTKNEPLVCNNEERWVYQSIIWTRADLEVKRVPVKLLDIAAVIVWLPHITILIISVYV